MQSKDIASESKPSSVADELTETMENNLSYKESLIGRSNPKIQIQEIEENIRAAESNYDSTLKMQSTIKMQWDLMKSRHQNNLYDKNESTLSQKSSSSYASLKITISDQSNQKESAENDNSYNLNQECQAINDNKEESEVQIVLTPRSYKKDSENNDGIIPNPNFYVGGSLESIKTNKRTKKTLKAKKKSQINRMNDEPLKTSAPTVIYATKTKRKKFHGRLRNSNSKSTIATRDTNFSDKKVEKRKFKRQKSLDRISAIQSPQLRKRVSPLKARESKQLNSKECVQIYHNTALKSGSLSVVSSRHSKITPAQIPHLLEETTQAIGDNKDKKEFPISEQTVETGSQISAKQADFEEKNETQIRSDEYHMHEEHANGYSPDFYDPFSQRSYEMPTMASKMKRVHRPYFHRFHIRSIPFVVGTSISPSHNLGLNIQQVLSIIKTRQPTVPGISPLLIRKVSRGIQPVTTIFEHINNQYASGSYKNPNCSDVTHGHRSNMGFHQDISSYSYEQLQANNNLTTSSMANQVSYKQNFTCEPLYEEDEDCQSMYSESQSRKPIPQGKSNAYEIPSRPDGISSQFISSRQQNPKRKHGQQLTEVGTDDSLTGNHFQSPSSNKEITEVLMRLRDQYDKMITQHEKLKEQLEKRKDKSLVKEVSELEEALCAKDQEIQAVVNLFREVLSLKQQMKLLHQRNSFVCIATEDPSFQHASRSAKMQARARTAGPFVSNTSRPRYYCGRRAIHHEAPHALRLTGLLRQIQAFQRQLALA